MFRFNSRPKICNYMAAALLLVLSQAASAILPCQNKQSLPAVSGSVVNVSTETQLQSAVSNLQDNTTILLKAGTYNLTSTLYIHNKNVTLRGDGDTCDQVVLVGKGMENASYGNVPFGVWTDASNLTVMNLTIKNVYYHGVMLNPGAQSPTIESVQMLNTGEQFVKSSASQYGAGNNNGLVKNSLFAYENGPPTTDHDGGTGYTNGVDVHGGQNWLISGNRFENFHTPDSAANLWNPAILMWNGSSNTIAENNVFINVDRAIAFGLMDRSGAYDHSGGIIRNNMIYYAPGLFSSARKADSDGAIIVWNSPGTVVVHNTVLTSGNVYNSVQFRFNTAGAQAINNLLDATMGSRDSATYTQSGNSTAATPTMFKNPATGDLRLLQTATAAIDKVNKSTYAPVDIDGHARGANGTVDIGAYEFTAAGVTSPPNPPSNIMVKQL